MFVRNCRKVVTDNAIRFRYHQNLHMSLSALSKPGLSNDSDIKDKSTVDTIVKREDEKNLTYRQKMKNYWNRYGLFFVGTYLSVYATTLAGLFVAFDSGVLSAAAIGMDTKEIIHGICDKVEHYSGFTSLPNYIREYPRVGTFLVAWFTTKFTEPVRMGVSIAIVPPLAMFMKRYNLHDRQRDKFIEEHEDVRH